MPPIAQSPALATAKKDVSQTIKANADECCTRCPTEDMKVDSIKCVQSSYCARGGSYWGVSQIIIPVHAGTSRSLKNCCSRSANQGTINTACRTQ
jgi:hypothetical protein